MPLQSGAPSSAIALGIALMAPRSSGPAARFGAKAVCTAGFLLIASSFPGLQLLDQREPVWLVLAVLSLQGLGMGSVMAPATESIVSTLQAVADAQGGGDPEAARRAAGVVAPAQEAFVAATHVTAIGRAAAALVAAVVVLIWVPGRRRVSAEAVPAH